MSKKKTIITAIVLLAVLLIGGLLAYFTDTEERTNVFTLGNVNIQLNETGWAKDGNTTNYTLAAANNITPNKVIAKDPTITNIGNGSNGNDAYVFLKVEVPYAAVKTGAATTAVAQDLFSMDIDTTHWTLVSGTANGGSTSTNTNTYVYVYGTSTDKTDMTRLVYNASTPALFNNVTFADVSDPTELNNVSLNIKVTAYGIQADGLTETTAADIFAKF